MRAARAAVSALLVGWLGLACAPASGPKPAELENLRRLAGEVDGQRTWADLLALVSAHSMDTPEDCSTLRTDLAPSLCHVTRNNARQLVQDAMEASGFQVQRQEVFANGRFTANLVVDLPGTSRPDEIILLGAHYDTYYAGADDNSSGAAALMEAMRVLSRHRFQRTIRFVGFDLEEFGFIGSNRYVETLKGEKLVNAVVLDMIGYYSSTPGSQRSLPGLPSPDRGDFLAIIGNSRSSSFAADAHVLSEALELMKVVTMIAPNESGTAVTGQLMRSDHASFWLTGQTAVFLTDTADFRNANYHQPTDRPETLDQALYIQAVRLAITSVAWWAGGPL